MCDAVYFVRPGDNNEELRWSLRSLTNVPHRDVWIVGHKPPWVRNVGHLPVAAPGNRTKWLQAVVALTEACRSGEIPDRFQLWNDDFFALKPTTIPHWHKGPVEDYSRYGRVATNWKAGMQETVNLLHSWGIDRVLDYELHVPMIIDKQLMAEALSRAALHGLAALQRRTLYGNLHQIGGTLADDVGFGNQRGVPAPGQVWVATNDNSFGTGEVGHHIRALFPDPSPYEEA